MTKEQVVDVMLELYSSSKEAKSWLEFYIEPDVKRNWRNTRKQSAISFSVGKAIRKTQVSGSATTWYHLL